MYGILRRPLKFEKKIYKIYLKLLVSVKTSFGILSYHIFVAFSEHMNFKNENAPLEGILLHYVHTYIP